MRPNIGRVILGGFVGTLAITFLMYKGAPMMGMPKMDAAAMLGKLLGGWAFGMIMHFINGTVIFPLIYAFLIFGIFPGQPVVRGILWGLTLWLLAAIAAMSIMVSMMSVFGSMLGHVVYGALLGWIGGPAQVRAAAQPNP